MLRQSFALLNDGEDKVARKLMFSSIGYLTGMQIIYTLTDLFNGKRFNNREESFKAATVDRLLVASLWPLRA